jgi:hypothetical protein
MKMVCDRCKVNMECLRVGLVMDIDEYSSVKYDLYECPSCLIKVRTEFGKPFPRTVRKIRVINLGGK